MRYNEEHGIVPQTVKKDVRDLISIGESADDNALKGSKGGKKQKKRVALMTSEERAEYIESLTREMKEAASKLDFERAAFLRDRIRDAKTTK